MTSTISSFSFTFTRVTFSSGQSGAEQDEMSRTAGQSGRIAGENNHGRHGRSEESHGHGYHDQSGERQDYGNSRAFETAMAKIMSIIFNMQNPQSDAESKSSVTEFAGHILQATGTGNDDTFNVSARSAYNISSGDGNDRLDIAAANLAYLDAGNGDDSVGIVARYINAVDGGKGNDTLTLLASRLADGVFGGEGDDTINVTANTILNVNGGAGNDTLNLIGKRIHAGGGAGDDTINIQQTGDEPAVLSFLRGDGNDTVNTDGPINIRFGFSDFFANVDGTDATGYGPADLSMTVADNQLTIASNDGKDKITVNFEPGKLASATPSFQFVMDKGAYVLKIS